MFSRPAKIAEQRRVVRVITPDRLFEQRIRNALGATHRFHVEASGGSLAEIADGLAGENPASLLIIELRNDPGPDLAALEALLGKWSTPPAVIIMSDRLAETVARRFLKLQIADWLPKHSSDIDVVQACENALKPAAATSAGAQARCTAFYPAIGGSGNTTLSLASASVLGGKGRSALSGCCVVDLNFQSGSVADYLDLTPNLQLSEIAGSPNRLDAHLLEVMLSRHSSGLAVLAAPPSLNAYDMIEPDLVGRLLDLISSKFQNVVIDMPRIWLPWCESVVRGADKVFIVTEMTVAGLRQARRVADMLEQTCNVDTSRSVIVNKCPWLDKGGVTKANARQLLGDRLSLFIPDRIRLVREAQNRGVLLSDVTKSNKIGTMLQSVLAPR